jgi:hypothetical protein
MNCSIHGSLNITEDGISSGYTNINNYILTTIPSDSLKSNDWELQIKFRKTTDYSTSNALILLSTSATGYVPIEMGVDKERHIYMNTYSSNSSSGMVNRLYTRKDVLVKNVWYTLKVKFTDLRISAQLYGDGELLHEHTADYVGALDMYSNSSSKLIFGADVDYSNTIPGSSFYLDLSKSYLKINNKRHVFYAV